MSKKLLCLGTSHQFEISDIEQIELFHKIGFDAFFTGFNDNLKQYRKTADELAMIYQSIHAPFKNAAKMWQGGDDGKMATDELVRAVFGCASVDVPILVCHTYIGFDKKAAPTEMGIENFYKVISTAKENGINIAFENTEGDVFLDALMNEFRNYSNVGFCWDTGHELCYNNKDMMSLYGDRLICTHLNDNLGITDLNNITWIDDLHLLPFDGKTDWQSVASRLKNYKYEGILTFELCRKSKPNRHENDIYDKMNIKDYIKLAFERAQKVSQLLD